MNKGITGLLILLTIVFSGLLHSCSCTKDVPKSLDKAGIDWAEIQDRFGQHQYREVLEEIYWPFVQSKTDTFLVPTYIALSSARMARIYHSLFEFEKELGRKLYHLFIKNKKLTNSKKYGYFYSFYFYLSDSTKKAAQALRHFSQLAKNEAAWRHDANLLNEFYKKGRWLPGRPELGFNISLFNSIAHYSGIDDVYPTDSEHSSQLWKLTELLLMADSSSITDLYKILSTTTESQPLYKEELGQVKTNNDSVFTFYQRYYNPLLLAGLTRFYSQMALDAFHQLRDHKQIPEDLYLSMALDIAVMLEEQSKYREALAILNNLDTSVPSPLLNGFVKILSYYCKNRLSSRPIDIKKRLDALGNPILQSYFLFKAAQLGHTVKDKLLAGYFNFNRFNRTQQLTCSEYLGHYYLENKRYRKAQSYYQRRLLGGSFDLSKNAPQFLIRFAKAYYYNELNKDQGLWILRKITQRYPAVKQVEQLYASILAEKIFK